MQQRQPVRRTAPSGALPSPGAPRAVLQRWGARARSPVGRRELRRRAVAVLVAVVVLVVVARRVDDAARVQQRWGATRTVLVAASDLPAGHALHRDDLRRISWPVELVPPSAPSRIDEGQHLRHPMARGEVLTRERLGPGGAGAWASVLDDDEVAVQLPVAAPLTGAAPGDRVDVMGPATGAPPDGTAVVVERVATAARLLQLDDTTVTVAVHRTEATSTTAAALGGLVGVVVRP